MKFTTDESVNKSKDVYRVYALVNPINSEVFYIGCTTKNLQDRLKNHYSSLREAYNTDRRKMTLRHEYLKDLYPTMATIVLLAIANESNWKQLETEYILKYRELNPNLTNVAVGGVGGDTYTNLSSDDKLERQRLTKLALTGRVKPEGFAENLSITRTGAGNTMAGFTKYGKLVQFDINNNIIKIYQAGYELTEEFGKYFYGNVIRALSKVNHLSKYHYYHKSTNTFWNFEHNLEHKPTTFSLWTTRAIKIHNKI